MQISVIVPVYNVERYVGKCLDSILAQTYTDFEVIVVDDGSTDGSGAICDEYARKDSRITVFHIENGGVSAARNLAVQKAQGTYLAFVDSDDYVEPDLLLALYRKTEEFDEVDCVICASRSETEDGELVSNLEEPVPSGRTLELKRNPQILFANPAMWNKLYVREIVVQHGIAFDCGLTLAEDLVFYLQYVQYCRNFVYVNLPLYHYIQRGTSAMNERQCEKNRSVLRAFDRILEVYRENHWYEAFQKELEYLAIYHVFITSVVRIVRMDARHPLLREFRNYVEERFPGYDKNPYLYLLDRNKKIIYRLLQNKWYAAVRILFQIKEKRRRPS